MVSKKRKITFWPQGKPEVKKFSFSRGSDECRDDDGISAAPPPRRGKRRTYLGDNGVMPSLDAAIDW